MNGSTLVIGAGTNLGGRWSILRAARDLVASRFGVADLRVAPVWETPPMGPPQPDYLNTAFALPFDRPLDDALAICRSIERDLGRERRDRWGPRTLDLDLLWHASQRSDSDNLTVPHPGLRERTFALDPLLALVPDAVDPADGSRLAAVRAALPQASPAVALDAGRPNTRADQLADEAQSFASGRAVASAALVPVGLTQPWERGTSGDERRLRFLAAVHTRYDVQEGMLRSVALLEDSDEVTRAVLLLEARDHSLRDR